MQSPNLSFSLHLEKSAQKAFAVLRMIRRTFSRITRTDFQMLYGAYVRPLLEYANPVVYSGRTKDVILIERVQRAATKMVADLKSMDYETRERQLLNDKNKTDPGNLGKSLAPVYQSVNPCCTHFSPAPFSRMETAERQEQTRLEKLGRIYLPVPESTMCHKLFSGDSNKPIEVHNWTPSVDMGITFYMLHVTFTHYIVAFVTYHFHFSHLNHPESSKLKAIRHKHRYMIVTSVPTSQEEACQFTIFGELPQLSGIDMNRVLVFYINVTSKHLRPVIKRVGKDSLQQVDYPLWELLKSEKLRQASSLELVASENFTGRAVLECISSCLTNKYTEGYPFTRLPRGTAFIDQIEVLAQKRLLELFKLKLPEESLTVAPWGVNVQPLSGSPANMAAMTALLRPHDRIMGLDIMAGGHPTHGHATANKKLSAASIYFETMSYRLDPNTGLIDYDALEELASRFLPKMIVAGVCVHPRLLDYARFRKICDSVGAILLADMAHIAGLVAADLIPSPFEHADIVTSTTHKTLRGPRSGMIFYRRHSLNCGNSNRTVPVAEYEERINQAIFPGLQSGPHENVIAAMACMAKEASEPHFIEYSEHVLRNSQALAKELLSFGLQLLTGGTDLHFVIVDLSRSSGRPNVGMGDAARVQVVADACGLTFSAVPVPHDDSFNKTSGLRIGTPALTSRGFLEDDFKIVASLINEVLNIAEECNRVSSHRQTTTNRPHETKHVWFVTPNCGQVNRSALNKMAAARSNLGCLDSSGNTIRSVKKRTVLSVNMRSMWGPRNRQNDLRAELTGIKLPGENNRRVSGEHKLIGQTQDGPLACTAPPRCAPYGLPHKVCPKCAQRDG
ncbi:serine hydroxymethyltransferase mitochondrial [Clonorchis sinensis]|uniref:Serine hydroxymethyltransferase n=1 Tax=Clonorchis sinensis TaxID=79923 RepID=G7YEE7_CLOSI|nr:serine hydroxymethyltransferase mitochondrial [Clonorchis sinensis]